MNFLFRLLLTLNATSLLVIIFLVQKGYAFSYFFLFLHPYIKGIPDFLFYIAYFLLPISLTGLSIFLCPLLGKDELKPGAVISIEHANNSFLPSYLGYFFVALSITSYKSVADFAEELTEGTTQIPESLARYIDYNAMAYDMAFFGD